MSEYTEADVLNAIKTMGLFRTTYPKDVVEKVVNNALKIADRLERADAQAHYLDRMRQTTKRAGYADGYIQAVKDVKGDNNDNNK